MKHLSARLLACLLCLSMLMLTMPLAVTADSLTEGDYSYQVSEDGTSVTITKYRGTETDVVIPDTLGGLPVTAIGNYAFELKTAVQTVDMPDTLQTIGYCAFNGCKSLTAAVIPHSVTEIYEMAFYNCTALETVDVGPYTLYIASQAFHNTKWIDNAEVGPLYIGRVLYTYIGSVPVNGEVTVKYGTASIAPYAFQGQAHLTAVYLPVGLREINTCAFLNCTRLISARIPPSVTTIDDGAFLNANGTAVYSTYESAAYTYAKANSLYFEYDETLDYPDGDMNCDKKVNTTDFRIVLRHLLDENFGCDQERLASCDIVYDGTITTLDVRTLLQKALGII